MRVLISIWLCLTALVSSGQIIPKKKSLFPGDEFVIYIEHTDTVNGIHYQVGRHEPKGYTFDKKGDKWIHVPIEQNKSDHFHHTHAPIYLKVKRQKEEVYYFLDSYYDVDMFRFPELPSDNLTIIAGRYSFYLYDIRKQTLSHKQIPGLEQYEGEDAISGLYSALTLFDNERFLLGNVQGFGVFCFDISNPAKPSELLQYRLEKPNGKQFYTFFPKTDKLLFDMIIAQQDASSESAKIERLYRKLGIVRYAIPPITKATNEAEQPAPWPSTDEHYLLHEYFAQIAHIKKHIYTGKTEEFCSAEYYEYENGIRYSFTDFGPCEQCGHGVNEIFIPNFTIRQGFIFMLSFYRDRTTREIYLETANDKEICLLWEHSTIKIIPHENGILIVEDIML